MNHKKNRIIELIDYREKSTVDRLLMERIVFEKDIDNIRQLLRSKKKKENFNKEK